MLSYWFKILVLLFVLLSPSLAYAQAPAQFVGPVNPNVEETKEVLAAQTTASSSATNDQSLAIANILEVSDKDVKDGDIISSTKEGYKKSRIEYDPRAVGVVSQDAAIVLNMAGANGMPIVSTGNAYVNVSTQKGPIKKGDLIATSTVPGVGVKAVEEGYVIGSALEDYTQSDTNKIGQIGVALNMHYFNNKPTIAGNLMDLIKISRLAAYEKPAAVFKYIMAALVLIASIVFGFLSFGRTAAKGVEALGRNPMAGKIIQLGIIFNVGITVAIIGAGLFVAILILRL